MKKLLYVLDKKIKKYGYINFYEMLMDLKLYPSVRKSKQYSKSSLKRKGGN